MVANNSSESQSDSDTPASGFRLLFSLSGWLHAEGRRRRAPARLELSLKPSAQTNRHGRNQAFYSPAGDYVQLPPFEVFKSGLAYYSVLAHEHMHWIANVARCNRELGKRFAIMPMLLKS